jgi:hypothetical protein
MEWEVLDNLRLEGADQAASKCRKLSMGNMDWCPTATKLRAIVLLCWLCCHQAQGTKPVSRSYHQRVQKKSRLQNEVLPTNIARFVEQYKVAQREWRVFARDQAQEERSSFLESLTTSQAENKVDVANELKQLQMKEEQ